MSQQRKNLPDFEFEKSAASGGFNCIAGIDEAGRGPIAGPVVAASVILKSFNFKNRIDDSKRLSSAARHRAFAEICEKAYIGVGFVDKEKIEEVNILKATMMAMEKSVLSLPIKPDFLLVDGTISLRLDIKQKSVIKGDQKSLSIAAASIVAKVSRDKLMIIYGRVFPEYAFAAHKGYGTKAHFNLIEKHGLCPIHRRDFIE